jgi:hypothetical protein
MHDAEAKDWLLLAKSARAAKHFSMATDAVLHAEALGCKRAVLEHAKLLYSDGQVQRALSLVDVDERAVKAAATSPEEHRRLVAKRLVPPFATR